MAWLSRESRCNLTQEPIANNLAFLEGLAHERSEEVIYSTVAQERFERDSAREGVFRTYFLACALHCEVPTVLHGKACVQPLFHLLNVCFAWALARLIELLDALALAILGPKSEQALFTHPTPEVAHLHWVHPCPMCTAMDRALRLQPKTAMRLPLGSSKGESVWPLHNDHPTMTIRP